MFRIGQIISYLEMCSEEGTSLQRGMNFRLRGGQSVFLMSIRKNAPYADRVEENGSVLIYEGHDQAVGPDILNPKLLDQPMHSASGSLTQNGKFFEAAKYHKEGNAPAELIKVYEKIRDGIWTFNGYFLLTDAWLEVSNQRQVFKFRLEIIKQIDIEVADDQDLGHERMIPSSVKLEVWKRDKGCCRICGSQDNLHFDHIIPYSRGGTSLLPNNIQLLCARHNLAKRDRIE